jgi:hypothetical protein
MRRNPRIFRLTATVAVTALLWDTALPLAAVAQPSPPPLAAPNQGRPDLAQPDQNQGDPPARVGRIASMTGAVSFHNEGDTTWSAASLNYPVSSGNSFWTEQSASARLEISDSRIFLAGASEFDVTTLDASGLQAVMPQGETYLNLRDLAPNEVWSIQTPRGLVRLSGQGRYGIVVGTTDQPTQITVIDGSAQVEGPGVSLQVANNQAATITGTDTFQGGIGPVQRDAFLTASMNAERPRPAPAKPIPAQVIAMAGGSDLEGTGSWSEAPTYGHVWYPPVAANWVPYREGHWAYVAPWGWTWIDNASWGFAPFHYGRWVQIGGRWAWTPGSVAVAARPVYAPALVTFIGVGAGVALGAALTTGSIGWVPLGPREPFHPWYHASPNYVREVNVTHVTNINTTIRIDTYINRGAATSIPVVAMRDSRPIRGIARPVTAQEFAAARPIEGRQPLRPTAETAGVTPALARRLDLAPAHAERPAPGPAVRPLAAGFARPAFPSAGNRPVPAAGEPGRPGAVAPEARPNAPGRPGGPGQPGPEIRPGAPGHPEAHPEAPAQPGARPTESGHPEAHPEAPAQPGARPTEPNQPGARPTEPGHPEARPGAAAQPGARPTEPGHPEARPGAAAQPGARPTEPGHPEARPGAAAQPGPRPTEPGHPEARPGAAAQPGARPTEPGHPEARPGAAAQSGARPTTPGHLEVQPVAPARPEARPAAPARPEAKPVVPARPEAKPVAPVRPEAKPVAPARPEAGHAAPARPEAKPAPSARPESREHKKEPGDR